MRCVNLQGTAKVDIWLKNTRGRQNIVLFWQNIALFS